MAGTECNSINFGGWLCGARHWLYCLMIRRSRSGGTTAGLELPSRDYGNGRLREAAEPARGPDLPANSAGLLDGLLGEITNLLSPDSAIDWAKAALVAKNRLTADDATQVADAFDQRLSA